MKANFPYIYSSYALCFWGSVFLPRQLPRVFVHEASMNFTCALSNTPGPLKPMLYTDRKGGVNKAKGTHCTPYIIAGGRIGLTISAISYADSFRFSVVCDEAMMDETQSLNDMISRNILKEIERMESTPVPDNKKTD